MSLLTSAEILDQGRLANNEDWDEMVFAMFNRVEKEAGKGLVNSVQAAKLFNVPTDTNAMLALMQLKSERNEAYGYPSLDGNKLIPSMFLPSFVDDVLELLSIGNIEPVGAAEEEMYFNTDDSLIYKLEGGDWVSIGSPEKGKVYIDISENINYRWGGSTLVEISASPGSTDAVIEGAVNKYFHEYLVLATVATGFAATNSVITAADSLLTIAGKTQGQINAINNILTTTLFSTAHTWTGIQTYSPTVNATVNSQVIDAMTIELLGSNGAFTNVSRNALRLKGGSIMLDSGQFITVSGQTVYSGLKFSTGSISYYNNGANEFGFVNFGTSKFGMGVEGYAATDATLSLRSGGYAMKVLNGSYVVTGSIHGNGDWAVGKETASARLHVRAAGNDNSYNILIAESLSGISGIRVIAGDTGYETSSKLLVKGQYGEAGIAMTGNGLELMNAAGANVSLGAASFNVTSGGYVSLNANGLQKAANYLGGGFGDGFSITSIQSYSDVTSGTWNALSVSNTFAPASGSGVFNSLTLSAGINQNAVATGITRGIFSSPTLTSAYNYRAFEFTSSATYTPKAAITDYKFSMITPIVNASVNSQVINGLDITLSGSNGAFTGVTRNALRLMGGDLAIETGKFIRSTGSGSTGGFQFNNNLISFQTSALSNFGNIDFVAKQLNIGNIVMYANSGNFEIGNLAGTNTRITSSNSTGVQTILSGTGIIRMAGSVVNFESVLPIAYGGTGSSSFGFADNFKMVYYDYTNDKFVAAPSVIYGNTPGALLLGSGGGVTGSLYFQNASNGNQTIIRPSASTTTSWVLTLPVNGGTAGYSLVTDSSGTTSWAARTLTDGSNATGTWGINITGGSGYVSGYDAGSHLIYWGWSGSRITSKVDGTTFGSSIPMDITGNAATATLAANSTLWGGIAVWNGIYTSGTINSAMIYNSTNSEVEFATAATFRTWLGSITSTATAGFMPYMSSATNIANSGMFWDGATMLIGTTTTPSAGSSSVGLLVRKSITSTIQLASTDVSGGGSVIGGYVGGGMVLYTYTGVVGSEIYTERARIAGSGNMLIGTTSDNGSNKLQVNGSGYFNGAFQNSGDITTDGNILLLSHGPSVRYSIIDATNVYPGRYTLQAGAGSAGYGGSLHMYGHSHTTKAGWIVAGISAGSGGKFGVQDTADGAGGDVFTVDAGGNVVAIGRTTTNGITSTTSSSRPFIFRATSVGSNYGTFLSNSGADLAYMGDAFGSAASGGTDVDFAIVSPNGELWNAASTTYRVLTGGSTRFYIDNTGVSTFNGDVYFTGNRTLFWDMYNNISIASSTGNGTITTASSFGIAAPTITLGGDVTTTGFLAVGTHAYLSSGGRQYFDAGVSNDYSIYKSGSALRFEAANNFYFNNSIYLTATTGGTQALDLDTTSASYGTYTRYRSNGSPGWEVGMGNTTDTFHYILSYGAFGGATYRVRVSTSGDLETLGDLRTNSLLRIYSTAPTIDMLDTISGVKHLIQGGTTFNFFVDPTNVSGDIEDSFFTWSVDGNDPHMFLNYQSWSLGTAPNSNYRAYIKTIGNTSSTMGLYVEDSVGTAILYLRDDKLMGMNGNMIVGTGVFSPSGRVHIVGATSDSSTNALYIQDNTSNLLLALRNDGRFNLPSDSIYLPGVPVGRTTVTSNGMYRDTAANVLAAGDKVLALKN
jgi:hypothetical protein